jgi:hypothetical protein
MVTMQQQQKAIVIVSPVKSWCCRVVHNDRQSYRGQIAAHAQQRKLQEHQVDIYDSCRHRTVIQRLHNSYSDSGGYSDSYLIFHEGHQRGHYYSEAWQQQCRQLVGQ